MGTIRDTEAFGRIGGLLEEMIREEDPLQALETIYPRLSDYGFCLQDCYIKVVLMFSTWQGTKKSFGQVGR